MAGGVVGGTPLAEGKILEGELGMGSESWAEGGEQIQESKHARGAHDATGRMLALRIPALTDGKTASRMASWRATGAALGRNPQG